MFDLPFFQVESAAAIENHAPGDAEYAAGSKSSRDRTVGDRIDETRIGCRTPNLAESRWAQDNNE